MSGIKQSGPAAISGLQAQVEQILDEARRQGASACEVAVSVQDGLTASVRQREVESIEFIRDQGFSITVYSGQRKGSASTTVLGSDAVREAVAAALAIA